MPGKRVLLVGMLLTGLAATGCRSWCEHHVCPPAQPACYAPAPCAPACCTPCVPAANYAPAAPAYNNPGACCAPAAAR